MVTVKYTFSLVILILVQNTISRPQDAQEDPLDPSIEDTPSPDIDDTPKTSEEIDYDKLYGDYEQQYQDIVKQSDDYAFIYEDYVPVFEVSTPPIDDLVENDNVVDDATYTVYNDYSGKNEYVWQYEDYGYDPDFGSNYNYGDRNNPMDTVLTFYDESGEVQEELPWVYIVVPVVQVDMFVVDGKNKEILDIELELPVETYFFELGNYGMAHVDLSDYEMGGNHGADYGIGADYMQYDDYGYYPNYNQYYAGYNPKAELFDVAEQLPSTMTMDYPGIEHDSMWVNWIFMMPHDELIR